MHPAQKSISDHCQGRKLRKKNEGEEQSPCLQHSQKHATKKNGSAHLEGVPDLQSRTRLLFIDIVTQGAQGVINLISLIFTPKIHLA
jgi:hypothetical protein